MNRKELIDLLADSVADMTKADASRVYDRMVELARERLATEGEFMLPGLGALKARVQKARIARNPKTGAPIHVPEKKTVRFSAYKELKELLNPALAQPAAAEAPAPSPAPPAPPAESAAPTETPPEQAEAPSPQPTPPEPPFSQP